MTTANTSLVLILACFVSFTTASPNRTTTQATFKTPRDLEAIFKARCIEYTTVVNPQAFKDKPKDCNQLWVLFSRAFANKAECTAKATDYMAFVKAADHFDTIQDKLLLWNGNVYPFVVDFARQSNKYITIRDQLAVFILRNIDNWCGQTEPPGINYKRCPGWNECEGKTVVVYWEEMSRNFVNKARGIVYVMFNASSPVVYNPKSIFAKMELANMHKDRTKILHAILVTNLNEQPTENCKQGSMKLLRKTVEKKGMKFRCWQNNRHVRYLQCLKAPQKCSGAAVTSSNILLLLLLFILPLVPQSLHNV